SLSCPSTSLCPYPTLFRSSPNADLVESLVRSRQPDLVTYSGWEAIDRHERSLGQPSGRPRVKLTRIEEMLRIAADENPQALLPHDRNSTRLHSSHQIISYA